VKARAPLTASSDMRAPMPDGPGARLDRIHAAAASLAAEERRLGRLGLADAARRCREQRRYWEFLAAVFALEPEPDSGSTLSPREAVDWDRVFGLGEGPR
jgi:hypothetical protein